MQRVVEKCRSWGVTRVLEVGPGGGVLTMALLKAGFKVTAIEKDDRFAERLPTVCALSIDAGGGTLTVVNEDVLDFDLAAWCQLSSEPTAIVGNIPYNISSSIVMWALPCLDQVVGMQLLTQLEFAQRVAAKSGTKAYGSLTVYTQLRANVTFDCKVEKGCFRPVPKVDSALISLQKRADKLPQALLDQVETLTRQAFTQRRKKLRNAVKPFLTTPELEAGCPIDLSRRPDELRIEEFVQLTQYLCAKD